MIKTFSFSQLISFFGLLFSITFLSYDLHSQDIYTTTDTIKKVTFEEVVITANRYENKIFNSGATVALVGINEIKVLPVLNFSNALKLLPGIFVSSTDGMGLNPQITLRGFYGGGEAEYMTMLVDGIPVNDLESGLANYNLLPLSSISKIELLRGGSSPLYGDAAMGGVMNVITEKKEKKFLNASLGFGSFSTLNLGINMGAKLGNGFYEIYGNQEQTNGFRNHSKWKSTTFGGKIKYPVSPNSTLSLNLHSQLLNSQEPGSLTDSLANDDRLQSTDYFREDGKDSKKHLVNIGLRSKINKTTDLDVSLNYQYKNSDQTRTFQQPSIVGIITETGFIMEGFYDTTYFGDTKLKNIKTNQIELAIRLFNQNPRNNLKISGGIEANYGNYDYSIFDRFTGWENDYKNNFAPKDTVLNASGKGFRFKSAAWLGSEIILLEPLCLFAGLRYDILSDDFNGDKPWPDTTISKVNTSLSPKLALNLITGKDENYSGSIYLSYSQAFKAPTINQIADLNSLNTAAWVTIPELNTTLWYFDKMPPFANSALEPQKSYNWEIGTYQHYNFSKSLNAEISLAGYYTEVKNEIDFDLSTYTYQNISSSKHTGLETNIKANYRKYWNVFVNVDYCEVKFASGENKDKFLKSIPNTSYLMGISYSADKGIGASLMMNGAGGIWLDDENTEKLKAFTVFSARIDYKWKFATIYLDFENIFDKKYFSTGYLQSGNKFLYPAVGRFIKGGLNFSF